MSNTSSSEIDEALWAAYRRDDKAAVMDLLVSPESGRNWSPAIVPPAGDQKQLEKRLPRETRIRRTHADQWP